MSQDLENRILKAEWTLDKHDDELQELRDTSEDLRRSLRGIEHNLAQIRWMAIGAGALYLASELGVVNALKLLA